MSLMYVLFFFNYIHVNKIFHSFKLFVNLKHILKYGILIRMLKQRRNFIIYKMVTVTQHEV